MKSLKSFKKLSASSLVESVMAIAIISICVLVAFMVYVNVVKQNDSIPYFNAKHKVAYLIHESMMSHDYESNEYDFKTYQIIKEVTLNKEPNTALLEFTIKIGNKSYKINHIIPIENDQTF
jgi:competence protein ComGC